MSSAKPRATWSRGSTASTSSSGTGDARQLQPGSYFAGLFAGARRGTEFVIGALLVSFGASATTSSSASCSATCSRCSPGPSCCAPIAVGTRLTLYWYLRRIAGRG